MVCTLRPGQRLRLVKYLGYGWSAHRSETAVRDQVAAALAGARHAGWEGLSRAQREYLDQFWADADVEIDDPALQQALRFGLYHVLQASARAERRAIGAQGLTGPGYDGHAFWDTEGFVLPLLMLTMPHAAADALRWRASTLPLATRRARALDLDGTAFPWRTINGAESGPYWPAGTAAFHVNADIACAFDNYRQTTADDELERECGLEVLVQTARLWHSIGHHDRHGRWHVDGVTGPDEYTALVSDNVFTNLMAARNLAAAAEACARHPRMAEDLGVTTEEAAAWLASADAVHIPYDEELGVGLTLTIDHLDLRHGGTWRYIGSDTDGGKYSFRGVFHGTPSPDGIVQTSESDSMPGHVCLETITFTEREGTTTVTQTTVYQSARDRDRALRLTTWPKTSTSRWSASSSCWHS